ncbi:MAG: hypothetical protein DRH57_04085 [Candidatus Cloacimonadota bacterium]|nr:MAG: hypothetical protein DRH57_04085 [Candidatus Cloacimonadota bacterium]
MRKDIFVLVEHRKGEIRDITFELLTKARNMVQTGGFVYAIVLAKNGDNFIEKLKSEAHRILCIENEKLEHFHSDYYQQVLGSIITDRKPLLTLFGQTSYTMDIAPSLAVQLDLPIVMGCIEFEIGDDKIFTINQVYGGKIHTRFSFPSKNGGIISIQPGTFTAEQGDLSAEIERITFSFEEITNKKFIQFVEAVAGEIDITQAEKIVAIGRGIKEKDNLQIIEDFAESIGAVVACSRPIVDAGWLPKERQVGSSGKTVKPKLYIALGISGDFQHLIGMRNADTIIAVNKDPNAPIFGIADYGIVDDLLKIVPALKKKIMEKCEARSA